MCYITEIKVTMVYRTPQSQRKRLRNKKANVCLNLDKMLIVTKNPTQFL